MDPLAELINALKKLPGLGNKSATRIAFNLLKKDDDELSELGSLIADLKKNLHTCEQCGNISNKNPCNICSDPLRDRKILCLVEDVEALTAFEQAGVYNGLYHVLGFKIAPIANEGFTDESREFLSRHVKKLKPEEIIIATSPKIEGDLTFYALMDLVKSLGVKKVSRLAYGIPVGSAIEFADRFTLLTALESRSLL